MAIPFSIFVNVLRTSVTNKHKFKSTLDIPGVNYMLFSRKK